MKKPGPRGVRLTLWTLIVPPGVWAAHFLFCYLWAATSCAKTRALTPFSQLPNAAMIATILALVLIAIAGVIAWRKERTPGDPPPHEQGTEIDRLRFLAKATLLLSGLSFVAVIFTALPLLFLHDCR